MNVEQTLIVELRAVAEGTTAPPPPAVQALLRDVERARQRRRLAVGGCVLAAAAVLAAIVLGSRVAHQDASPPPAHRSAAYYATGVPYVVKGTLYVDHQPQAGRWMGAQSAGDYTVATAADQSGVILHEGKDVLHIDGPLHQLVISPGGTKAAWIKLLGKDAGRLVVHDLSGGRDLGRTSLVLRQRPDSGVSTSLQVDDAGRVVYDINDQRWSWTPGSSPTRTHAPDPSAVNPPGFEGVDTSVRLSPDHLWGAWTTDGDGHTLTDVSQTLGVTVQKPGDPGSRFTLSTPVTRTPVGLVTWESPTRLLVQVPQLTGASSERVVACDITTRRCADATDSPAP